MMGPAGQQLEQHMDTSEAVALKLELMHTKARHMRLVDAKDWAGYAAILTEDFVIDLSEGTRLPVIHGRDAAMQMLQAALGPLRTVHHAHTPEIELDGDEARTIWPIHDRIVMGADKSSSSSYAYHHERWVRRNGHWLLAWHKRTALHTDVFPPTAPTR
jgi:hypothetical protein